MYITIGLRATHPMEPKRPAKNPTRIFRSKKALVLSNSSTVYSANVVCTWFVLARPFVGRTKWDTFLLHTYVRGPGRSIHRETCDSMNGHFHPLRLSSGVSEFSRKSEPCSLYRNSYSRYPNPVHPNIIFHIQIDSVFIDQIFVDHI
jgi:hypothetical protein